MARSELDRWRAEHPHAHARPEDFTPVREALRQVTLRAIMDTCEVSKATASGWRSGRHVPHLRFWPALASLAGVTLHPEIAALFDPAGGYLHRSPVAGVLLGTPPADRQGEGAAGAAAGVGVDDQAASR